MKPAPLALLAFAAVALGAAGAGACPACISNGLPARTADAYLTVTAVMSLTPLVFFGGLWLLLRPESKGDSDR